MRRGRLARDMKPICSIEARLAASLATQPSHIGKGLGRFNVLNDHCTMLEHSGAGSTGGDWPGLHAEETWRFRHCREQRRVHALV